MYPPVSTRRKRRPSYSTGSATRSRVIPGWSKVMARRFRAIRLKSVDFPTFGRPTSATVNSAGLISEMPQHRFAPRPVPLHDNEQLQVDPRPRLLLQLDARGRPDLLEDRAALSDHDPLLGIPFHENLGPDADQVLLRFFLVLVDPHRDAVGNLLVEPLEELFPDHLFRDEAHGEVGQVLFGVERRPLGQPREKRGHECLDAVPFRRGDKERRGVEIVPRETLPDLVRRRPADPVDLVHHEDARDRNLFEDPADHGILRTFPQRTVVDHVGDDIGLFADPAGGADHVGIEGPRRLVDPRAVEEDDLPPRLGEDPRDPVARRLRLPRDDRDLGAHDPVEQGRFADVGAAQQGDESGFQVHGASPPAAMRKETAFAAASISASLRDVPLPPAGGRPSTRTSTRKSRSCGGPSAERSVYAGSGRCSPWHHSCSRDFASNPSTRAPIRSGSRKWLRTNRRAASCPPSRKIAPMTASTASAAIFRVTPAPFRRTEGSIRSDAGTPTRSATLARFRLLMIEARALVSTPSPASGSIRYSSCATQRFRTASPRNSSLSYDRFPSPSPGAEPCRSASSSRSEAMNRYPIRSSNVANVKRPSLPGVRRERRRCGRGSGPPARRSSSGRPPRRNFPWSRASPRSPGLSPTPRRPASSPPACRGTPSASRHPPPEDARPFASSRPRSRRPPIRRSRSPAGGSMERRAGSSTGCRESTASFPRNRPGSPPGTRRLHRPPNGFPGPRRRAKPVSHDTASPYTAAASAAAPGRTRSAAERAGAGRDGPARRRGKRAPA